MKIEICNERLLARFGVDRLLLLAAEHLRDAGAHVRLSALRADDDLVAATGLPLSRVAVPRGLDLAACERFATRATLARWLRDKPDAVLIGGWPFFDLAARAPALGVASVFIDAGAVPHDGLAGQSLANQRDLRRIRAGALPAIQNILPISRFIAQSQTLPERGHARGVATVLLGADHLPPPACSAEDPVGRELRARKQEGQKLVLHLGRFEACGYKSSPALYPFLRTLRQDHDAAALVLAEPRELDVPEDLADRVVALGRPGDAAMAEYMRLCDCGVSFSTWEGFNLPLAEMQQAGRPAFVLAIGAHPEVVADPLVMCLDGQEMAERVTRWLAGDEALTGRIEASLSHWRGSMRWADTMAAWADAIRVAVDEIRQARPRAEALVLTDDADPGAGEVGIAWDEARASYAVAPRNGDAAMAGIADASALLEAIIASRHPHSIGPPIARLAAPLRADQRRWLVRHGITPARLGV